MSWAKVDDHANEHDKQLEAGPEACWFWVCGLMYANRQRARDGLIPEKAIRMLYPVDNPQALAEKLVEVGLWVKTKSGYKIHNYHKWNPTLEQVEAERAAGRNRAAKSYENKKAKKRDSSGEEEPKTPTEDEPKKTDSSGSTPLHSKPLQREEEIPPPPSEPKQPEQPRQPLDAAALASLRKPAERFERSFKQPAAQRADVLELHAEWRKQFGRGNTPLVVGSNHENAEILADAVDAYGVADCLLVARNAKHDGMVSGRTDEQGAKHESIAYIFGKSETFTRILRDGKARELAAQANNPVAMIDRLKSRQAGEA